MAATLFGPSRTLQWTSYFHYFYSCPTRYPSAKVGRVVGYCALVVALLGDAPPVALYAILRTFADRGNGYFVIHTVLTTLVVVFAVLLPGCIWSESARRARGSMRPEDSASHASPVLEHVLEHVHGAVGAADANETGRTRDQSHAVAERP